MISEKERIIEWLSRVALEIHEIKTSSVSSEEKIKLLRRNHSVLLVLTKVANGTAFMVGIPPITQNQINN